MYKTFALMILLLRCGANSAIAEPATGEYAMSLILQSPAFAHQGEIPSRHTCPTPPRPG
jgi:hypothetical protein